MAAAFTLAPCYLCYLCINHFELATDLHEGTYSAKGSGGILLGTCLLLRAVCPLWLIVMMYIKYIMYVVVMCINNYIYHVPLCTTPAVHSISLPPPAFILTFQTSEKLQTAGTFPFFPLSLSFSPQTCQICISFSFPNKGLFFLPN